MRHSAYRIFGLAVLLIANLLILAGVLLQSYHGRQDIIAASRHACQLRSEDFARIANIDRDQQQLDVRLAKPDAVRSAQLRRLLTATAVRENRDLEALDRHIDPHGWAALNSIGLRYVRALRHPYSCRQTFPDATFRIVSSSGGGHARTPVAVSFGR